MTGRLYISALLRRVSAISCCLLMPLAVLAQQDTTSGKSRKIQLIQADMFTYDRASHKDARKLVGDVVFKHDASLLYCDSAYLYISKNNLDAFGKVRIQVNDSTNAYGNKLVYHGDDRIAQLSGNVVLRDNQITLRTNYLVYDLKANVARYTTGADIEKDDNTLTSRTGTYDGNGKMLHFKDDVKLVNPDYVMDTDTLQYHTQTDVAYFMGPTTIDSDSNFIYCENGWYDTKNDRSRFGRNAYLKNEGQTLSGDSLYYDRQLGIGRAWNNITIFDSVQNIVIKGNYGFFEERSNRSFVTDEAVLWIMEEHDTLFLHADTLRSTSDSGKVHRTLYAYHHVRFFRTDLQGVCDSMVYSYKDSLIMLHGHPILWSEENQIVASMIRIRIVDNVIEKMFLDELGFITSEYDTMHYNQIKGRQMIVYFEANELNRIYVEGNAETIYYLCEEDSSLIGMNRSLSNRIMIYVKNGEIEKIKLYDKPEAVLYPPVGIPEETKYLKEFRWESGKRPQGRWDLF